jgi:hypothetical protein
LPGKNCAFEKNCVLICSVNALGVVAFPFHIPVSVTVAGVTLSKLPIAEDINPVT